MEDKGLLFIPDISGFTRFVTACEIDHSRRIVQELLETVIDANRMGLSVSEVEGDAVLFFKFGVCPDLEVLSQQVEEMFRAFHERLAAYELRRFCQCQACVSASNLTLKIISHYGEFTGYQVKEFSKLIGKDVIVAHQLLKNDIDEDEYWLVTASLAGKDDVPGLRPWIRWAPGAKRTEAGEIAFRYTLLSELRMDLKPAPLPDVDLSRMTRVFSLSREYDTHIIALCHATGDFAYRSRWEDGVRSVEELDHYLPRVGIRCRKVMEDGEVTTYVSSYSFAPDRIALTETVDDGITRLFTLESLDDERTRLTVDVYVKRGFLPESRFRLTRQKDMEASLKRSLDNLEGLVEELEVSAVY